MEIAADAGLRSLALDIEEENVASIRVAERLGAARRSPTRLHRDLFGRIARPIASANTTIVVAAATCTRPETPGKLITAPTNCSTADSSLECLTDNSQPQLARRACVAEELPRRRRSRTDACMCKEPTDRSTYGLYGLTLSTSPLPRSRSRVSASQMSQPPPPALVDVVQVFGLPSKGAKQEFEPPPALSDGLPPPHPTNAPHIANRTRQRRSP